MSLTILHAAETLKGGVATIVRQLLRSQEKSSFTTYCITPSEHSSQLENSCPRTIEFKGGRRGWINTVRFLIKFVEAVVRTKPDIVHLHSSFAGIFGRLILLLIPKRNKPIVVYTPHGWPFIMEGSTAKKKLYAYIERTLYYCTDVIICVSNYEANLAHRFAMPDAKIRVIYNGVEPPTPSSKLSPYDHSKINLLYIGRFDHAKGFDIATSLMKDLDGARYHLTAIGEAVQSSLIPPKIENITYTGWLPRDEISPYLQHADLLIMPSRWESFGLVAAEANSYGIPVVASSCCSLPEIIKHGENGFLFNKGDISSAKKIITQTNKERMSAMRSASFINYKTKFSSEVMCQKHLRAYGEAILARRQPSEAISHIALQIVQYDLDQSLKITAQHLINEKSNSNGKDFLNNEKNQEKNQY